MAELQLSEYDRRAILAIHAWKHPKLTWFDRAMTVINAPLEWGGDLAMKIPGVEWVIEKSFGGILKLLNDGAAATVRPTAIFAEFQPPVLTLEDIANRDLEHVDRAIGFLSAKYASIALVEGTVAGGSTTLLGPEAAVAAIPADVVALLGMTLRAVGEYATYTGFDIVKQEERLFALNVLGLASAPTDAAKVVAMAQLVRIAKDVALKRTWKQLNEHAFVQVVQVIAKALAIRLTKAKLGEVLPVAGAVIGGGFNAYFASRVCESAYFLYRERFLARKYGAAVIEETVKAAPSGDYGKGYVAAT